MFILSPLNEETDILPPNLISKNNPHQNVMLSQWHRMPCILVTMEYHSFIQGLQKKKKEKNGITEECIMTSLGDLIVLRPYLDVGEEKVSAALRLARTAKRNFG